MRYQLTLSTLALAAVALGCTGEGLPPSGPQPPADVRSAKPVANPLPAWTVAEGSLNFIDDGAGEYIGGQCGVQGQIFYSNYNGTTGGDATFDNIQPRKSSCGPRSIKVVIDGVARNVPSFNVRTVVGMQIGESRDQNFGVGVDGVANCTRLAWWTIEDGGAGGKITVTRTSETTWTATTSGVAQCRYVDNRTNIWTGNPVSDVQVNLGLREVR